VLPGQSYRTPQGAVIDGHEGNGGMVIRKGKQNEHGEKPATIRFRPR
jgi:hypothetical protein